MRIVAVSDTHHNTELLERCVRQAIADGQIDAFLHCGDGVRDLETVEPLLIAQNPRIRIAAVKGNCDLGEFAYSASELVELNGVRTLVTHGHLFQVKQGLSHLAKAARELNAALAFYGHTHRPEIVDGHGVTMINPGSLASLQAAGFAYLEVLIYGSHSIRENFIKRR